MNPCRFSCLLAACIFLYFQTVANADQPKPVKVFILAGQSNMQGQGVIKADPKRNELLEMGNAVPLIECRGVPLFVLLQRR